MTDWLTVERGAAPLIVSVPHAGTDIPSPHDAGMRSVALARRDVDWNVDRLYAFARALDATVIRTAISRSVIDVNRDPSGASLYPGQATTGLCPTTTFMGESLYEDGREPDEAAIAARRATYFDPYHAAIAAEIARLRRDHSPIVLYDAHSIVGEVPRLFEGRLPQFNIGTNDGQSCDPALAIAVAAACPEPKVINGRFKGGWITRHYGRPERGVHAIQMELAIRGYADEAAPDRWDAARAAPMQATLRGVLKACLDFAKGRA
ncbi:formiminoglutamase [Hephaestia caeni]|uniref:Formiminoglutamase n=1 Tax=Hephaestia caeni TaxID=645617 RepID=A0A397P4J3_9SPHN|nr:N-formylglutamate deformylase [Hephaestia caeni]RIA44486.1 formiminoglutamase [Hephaestia caeni]